MVHQVIHQWEELKCSLKANGELFVIEDGLIIQRWLLVSNLDLLRVVRQLELQDNSMLVKWEKKIIVKLKEFLL